MSLIDKNVLETFSAWADENENKHIFPRISESDASYFIDRESEEHYIMPYSFGTLAELRFDLERYSGLPANSQILKMMAMEICQNQFETDLKANQSPDCYAAGRKEDGKEYSKETIPDYVYVF